MESKKNIIGALLKVQAELKNPANSTVNSYFGNNYAPLPDILNLVKPILTKNDLLLVQDTGSNDDCGVFVQTTLYHTSGEFLETNKLILKPVKNSPQQVGSAITYGRRYQLSAILSISSEDDDDANAAEGNKTTSKTTQKGNGKQTQGKTQAKRMPRASQQAGKTEPENPQPEKMGMSQGESEFDKLAKKNPTIRSILKELETNKEAISTAKIVNIAKARQQEGLINNTVLHHVEKLLGVATAK